MRKTKSGIGAALALLLAAGAVLAAAPAKAPDQIVRDATEQMRSLIRTNHDEYVAHPDRFHKVVDEVLVPRFDVRYIAQLVLGRNWRAASETQRERFAQAFKLMLIRSYADTLLENYDSVKAEWQPLRMDPDASDVVVHTSLLRSGGQRPVAIGFALHRVGDDWKIYDISVEAISLVTNFRSQMNSEIRRTGLDDVIARMEKGESFKPHTQAASGS